MDETIVNPDIKKTFPWKLVMIFLLFSGVIIIMGRYYYRYERNRIFTEQEKSLSAIATLKIKQISQWYSDKLADAVVIKDNEPLVSRIKQFFKDENQTGIRKEINIWLEALNTQYDYNSVALLDTLLRVKIATSNADPLADVSIRKELNNVIRYHKIVMTDLHKTGTSHAIRMDLLVPLIDPMSKEQKTIGLIILCIDPDKILFPLVQSWPTPSRSSETLILRREGDSVLFLNELRHRKNTALILKFSISKGNLLASKAVNGFEGLTEGIDYRNIPVIGALNKIPELPWFMVAKTDKEEILAPFKRDSVIIVFVIILLILINASIFGFWIWQQRINFFRSKLKDEVSIRELEERFTTAFRMSPVSVTISSVSDNKFIDVNNTFLEDMEYNREEVIGRTARELNIWADEGEREWIINEISEKGKIFGKVISYKTRTGKILYGLSSMSVIQVNGIPCNLSTVVNITERRKSEEKLVESEELFRKLFENMLNGFAYCKMIYEDGKPLDFLYLNVNESFATLTGLKDVMGKRVSEAIPGIQEADPDLLEKYNRVSSTGIPEMFETYVESLKMWFAISVYSPQKGYFVAVFDVITARKLADEKLHESRATLQSIIDNSNSLIYLVDTEGRFVLVNQPLQNLLSVVGEKLIGQSRDLFLPKEIADIHRMNDLVVIKTGKTQVFEEENIEPDGKHHYLTTKFPLYDNENNIYSVGGLSTDITERKRIEKTLKESEEKFRKVFFTNPDSVTITRLDNGTYVSVNNGFTKTFEYSEKEVIGKTSFDISIWYNIDERKYFINGLKTEGKVENFETKFYTKSRNLIDCLISATTIRLDGIDHVLSNTRNITERKNAELALLDSEERFRSLYENVTIGIYRTTSDGRILMANPALVKMLGFNSFEELADRNLEQEGYEPDYPRSKFLETIEKEGKILGLDSAWKQKNGKILFVRESAKAVKNAEGRMLYYDGTVEDITDRKKIEEALLENEKRLREAQDMAHLGFWLWDIKTGNVEWSDEVFKIFCLDPATFKPQINSILELSPWPEENQRDKELINRAIESHNPGTYEQRFIRPDKSIGYYYSTFRGSYDDEGDLISIVGTILDITERKLAEDALRESEDKFKYIFDHSLIAKSITLPSGEINVNRAFCDMLGYQPEELKKINWADISHPDDIKLTNDSLNLVLSGKKDSVRFTKRYIHKNGSVIWADVGTSLRRDANNNPQYFMTSVNDITERLIAEEALRDSEERFSKSFRTSPISFMIANMEDGRIIEINDAFTGISGYTREEAIGNTTLNMKIWIHKEDRKQMIDSLRKGKPILHMETMLRAKEGNVAIVLLSAQVIKLGYRNCIISSIEDITERKNAESQIKKLNEELEDRVIQRTELLEAANKELEAFSYSVSHDLRAPLRSVHGFTKILLEDYEANLDEEGKRICGIISSSATQMGELIDDLLSFSRIGRSSMNPSAIDMKKMAKAVFEGMTSPTERKRIKLNIGKLQKAVGDVALLGQVWTNLISNAIKYSSKKDVSEISIGSKIAGDMIIYFIKDNGVGFDMQYAHKLFGVFQRLHSEADFEGNGVGLAIVQRIILKHGGNVWAEGEEEKGATFYFSLPAEGDGQRATGNRQIKNQTPDARRLTPDARRQ